MADFESIWEDAREDERQILIRNVPREYNFSRAKLLPKNAKINEQSPLIQKYWLGKLAYELAMRCEKIQEIIQNTRNNYTPSAYALGDIGIENAITLRLADYGFLAMPENDVLETEHTSYPAIFTYKKDKININTRFKIEHLLDIIDGAPKTKFGWNNDTYKKWKRIAQGAPCNYMELITIN